MLAMENKCKPIKMHAHVYYADTAVHNSTSGQ